MAKLWQKENQKTDAKIEQFTIGNDPLYDLKLAKYDVLGSLAHITMLEKVGILKSEELNKLLKETLKLRMGLRMFILKSSFY
mgnify:CR=1 FL=1